MATSYAIFAVVFLLCVSGFNCRRVTKGSDGKLKFENITEVRVKSELNTKFDGKGLEPWYDVAKSFIHTVQKDDPPYGKTVFYTEYVQLSLNRIYNRIIWG